jgi:uncharacterized protein YegP (UPF0339 family)
MNNAKSYYALLWQSHDTLWYFKVKRKQDNGHVVNSEGYVSDGQAIMAIQKKYPGIEIRRGMG